MWKYVQETSKIVYVCEKLSMEAWGLVKKQLLRNEGKNLA